MAGGAIGVGAGGHAPLEVAAPVWRVVDGGARVDSSMVSSLRSRSLHAYKEEGNGRPR